MDESVVPELRPLLAQAVHECNVVADTDHEHGNPQKLQYNAEVPRSPAAFQDFGLVQLLAHLEDRETEGDQGQ
jgi:hypothetical protein